MLTGGQLKKAVLNVVDGDPPTRTLPFMYNPAELSTSKSANWNRPQQKGASSAGKPQFTGAGPQTVQMEIWFDAWDAADADVTKSVKTLFEWTKPTPTSIKKKLPRPPVLGFEWGSNQILADLKFFLKTVNAKYVLFKPDGTPVRASATLSFEEVPEDQPRQNPSSGARASRRSHVLDAGDSLHAVAYREYGDATLWRGVAAFNAIDDPLRVAAGTRILVPTADEARRLAAGEG
ncbi:MAG: peptidase M23 [Chloroflexi bacterium]|nr:peptidase M23 [Chloroflexota bacterium]